MSLEKYLNSHRELIEAELKRSIDNPKIPSKLAESINYSLLAGGKRIRPILALAGAEAVGSDCHAAVPFAVAIEMVHCFSLIHDDLPAMDNDDLRRGVPTNHKVYGDAMAILAGDGLMIEAFDYLLSHASKGHDGQYIKAAKLLAEASGIKGMTGGQAIDMESSGKSITLEELQRLHAMKTGALISAAVVGGAILGGGNSEQVDFLRQYGEKLGLAFQVADDILDIEGDEKEIGKPVGSDVSNKKVTYPSLMGINEAKEFAMEVSSEAILALKDFSQSAWPLRELATYVVDRRK